MLKVTLQGYIIVADSDLEIVKTELVLHKKLTIAEQGCLTFQVKQDKHNPNKFNVFEEFIDQLAFDNHQARVKSSNWGEVTKQVKRFYQITNNI